VHEARQRLIKVNHPESQVEKARYLNSPRHHNQQT
jgi:hypothetical protein